MKTIKLYDDNAYLTEFCATVLSCEKTERGYAVVLDKTAFFPEEGGQNADSGTLDGADVFDVQINGDVITHHVKTELSGNVQGKIDWDARYDKMQQHTGEHIVSGLVHRLYGYDNVGPSTPALAPRTTPSSGACAARTRTSTTWTALPPKI